MASPGLLFDRSAYAVRGSNAEDSALIMIIMSSGIMPPLLRLIRHVESFGSVAAVVGEYRGITVRYRRRHETEQAYTALKKFELEGNPYESTIVHLPSERDSNMPTNQAELAFKGPDKLVKRHLVIEKTRSYGSIDASGMREVSANESRHRRTICFAPYHDFAVAERVLVDRDLIVSQLATAERNSHEPVYIHWSTRQVGKMQKWSLDTVKGLRIKMASKISTEMQEGQQEGSARTPSSWDGRDVEREREKGTEKPENAKGERKREAGTPLNNPYRPLKINKADVQALLRWETAQPVLGSDGFAPRAPLFDNGREGLLLIVPFGSCSPDLRIVHTLLAEKGELTMFTLMEGCLVAQYKRYADVLSAHNAVNNTPIQGEKLVAHLFPTAITEAPSRRSSESQVELIVTGFGDHFLPREVEVALSSLAALDKFFYVSQAPPDVPSAIAEDKYPIAFITVLRPSDAEALISGKVFLESRLREIRGTRSTTGSDFEMDIQVSYTDGYIRHHLVHTIVEEVRRRWTRHQMPLGHVGVCNHALVPNQWVRPPKDDVEVEWQKGLDNAKKLEQTGWKRRVLHSSFVEVNSGAQ